MPRVRHETHSAASGRTRRSSQYPAYKSAQGPKAGRRFAGLAPRRQGVRFRAASRRRGPASLCAFRSLLSFDASAAPRVFHRNPKAGAVELVTAKRLRRRAFCGSNFCGRSYVSRLRHRFTAAHSRAAEIASENGVSLRTIGRTFMSLRTPLNFEDAGGLNRRRKRPPNWRDQRLGVR